jgi:hypothetical protein
LLPWLNLSDYQPENAIGGEPMAAKIVWTIALILAVAGCATTYHKSIWGGDGYTDEKIAEDTYKVTFSGNGVTERQDVLKMWHQRAATLCGSSGYEHNAIFSEKKSRDTANIYSSFVEHRFPYVDGTVKCTPDSTRVVDTNRP